MQPLMQICAVQKCFSAYKNSQFTSWEQRSGEGRREIMDYLGMMW